MIGRTVGHYEILEKLGEGGMGVVYKARDTRLNRFVAVKLLPQDKLDEDRLRRFAQEARTASSLNHPNIITIHDIASERGDQFIVMELVAGKTLDQLIPRKGMRLAEVLNLAVQMADAFAAAASAGVIHRDIKPGNIMVSDSGHVKVLDFGLAKFSEHPVSGELATATVVAGEEVQPRTREGTVIGTVSYMSPEQAEGKPLDPRSDIFSFGAVLYEMVTGQRAFRGETSMSTISAILRDDPEPAGRISPDVPRDLERVINRCLRKDPARRFQTMADVKVALLELKEESESGRLQGPAATANSATATGPRRTWILWACGAFAAILIAAAVFFGLRSRPRPVPVAEAEPQLVPFTSYPGTQVQPAFSPDGNQIAFAWTGGEGSDPRLYVKMIGTETALRLTNNYDWAPAWAPDGRSIAFLRRTGDRTLLCQVSPLGGNERRIAEFESAGHPQWSRDGKFLILAARETPAAGTKLPANGAKLVVVAAGTGEKRVLNLDPADAYIFPVPSPDGRKLAFAKVEGESAELMVADVDVGLQLAGRPSALKTAAGRTVPMSWTADSKKILYTNSVTAGAGSRLFRIAADGSSGARGVALTADGVTDATVSAQGNRLAYTRSYGDYNVWSFVVTGPGKVESPALFLSSTRGEWVRPLAFSPDGKRLVFESDRTGQRTVWLSNLDGSQAAPLLAGGAYTTGSPAWSPDGKWIAFDTRKDGNAEIYILPSDGGPARRLTNHPSTDAVPAWSPDAKWVYFGSDRTGRFEIFKAPLEGGETIQVTKNGGWGAQPSSDGKYLYYSRSRGPSGSAFTGFPLVALLRLSLDTGEETEVMDGVRERSWAVTPAGVWFLAAKDEQHPELHFFDFHTRKSARVAALPKAVTTGIALSPDGRRILYNQLDQQGSEILLVENFR